MKYLSSLISNWMPVQYDGSHNVAVDSHPRLSGIMDTINSTLAHGPKTRLPSEFYDMKGRDILDRICIEEWFAGYAESNEYRTIGIGAQVGDIVARMVGSAERNSSGGPSEIGEKDGETAVKFAMSGCHDTSLAAIMTSLGAFGGEKWPPYSSALAIELFRDVNHTVDEKQPSPRKETYAWYPSIFRRGEATAPSPRPIGRRPVSELSEEERERLDGYYVRLRYNDRPLTIPGCRSPGKHLEGDESFCTLVSCPSSFISSSFENGRC